MFTAELAIDTPSSMLERCMLRLVAQWSCEQVETLLGLAAHANYDQPSRRNRLTKTKVSAIVPTPKQKERMFAVSGGAKPVSFHTPVNSKTQRKLE